MSYSEELLPALRHLFDPRKERAISLAVTDAIGAAGGLGALASGLKVYSYHPDFEGITKTQIATLETMPSAEQEVHTSFGGGSVSQYVSRMCTQHGTSLDSVLPLLDSEEIPTVVAPTFFYNKAMGMMMLTGCLTIAQLPILRS